MRDLRNRPQPGVVVRVQFIVFLRPVKSPILFEQMLGGRTPRFNDIHQSDFTVFDCCDGTLLEYFEDASAFTVEPPEKPMRTLPEIIEDI